MDTPVLHIVIDSEGIPRTINRGVKVKMIALKHIVSGESVGSIATHYTITPADVHAALAYYYDNQDAFDRQMVQRRPLIEQAHQRSDQLKQTIQERLTSSGESQQT